MYPKLEDLGLIGNLRSAALVSKWGSIDWSCLPDFDSPSFFCKILDDKKGGFFSIQPIGFYQSSQIYKENTNILKTDFFNHSGRVILTDFMPLSKDQEASNNIPERGLKFMRRIKAKEGNHRIRVEIKVTPNFATEKAIIVFGPNQVKFLWGEKIFCLFSNNQIFRIKDDIVWCEFELKKGSEEFLGFGYYNKSDEIGNFTSTLAKKLYKETLEFWEWWASLCRYKGLFQGQVLRSALLLKLLTFKPTGAVVAAPTTSLPEKLGGNLNWDYRYVWLRDASFTMYALLGLGYLREAAEFMGWLEAVCLADQENLQIMYGIRGERELPEKQLKNLEGYEFSRPVRTGNKAVRQKQFDIYGEVLTCINLFVNSGGVLSEEMKSFIVVLVNYCCAHWKEKDAGIWEPRGGDKHHTYSKLMCWVGMDRGIRLAKKLNLKADLDYWQANLDEAKHDIIENGFNKKYGAFVDYYGSDIIDSSNLNIPLVGFLPASDPTVLSTLELSMSQLTTDWFVYRTNDQSDRLKAGEGAFFLSTFWVIDNLSALGRTKEAKIWLEKLLHFSTPLGLYAEQFDPRRKEHLGNFPQAFTHLGLINSCLNLERSIRFGAEKTATVQSERLKQLLTGLNEKIKDSFELLVPLTIRRNLIRTSNRRTAKHSLIGRILGRDEIGN